MNRRKLILTGLAAMLSLTSGCVRLREMFSSPDSIKANVTDAIALGATDTIAFQPKTRPKFVEAYEAITKALDDKVVTGGTLVAIMHGLPVKQYQGTRAKVLTDTGVYLFNTALGTEVNLTSNEYINAAAEGIKEGLRRALEQTK
jgi:hypothetical protein